MVCGRKEKGGEGAGCAVEKVVGDDDDDDDDDLP